jgi:hypothetical protein
MREMSYNLYLFKHFNQTPFYWFEGSSHSPRSPSKEIYFFRSKVNNINKAKEDFIMAIKTETIAIKVSPEEKEMIKKMAEEQDITVSKLLYRMVFKKEEEK